MYCKNCTSELDPQNNFCSVCGAKIIRERITIKSLVSHLLIALGWDSNFFVTLRNLCYKPQIVFKEYINGTRKKYANPFTFFAISLAISLFVINQYSEQFIQMSTTPNLEQVEQIESASLTDNNSESASLKALGFESQEELNKSIMLFQIKHYNFVSFLYLPLCALIAFFVFGKPYNIGEHLVVNTYILSIATFLGVVLFVLSLATAINLFFYSTFLTFLYYSYAYKKFYELSFGRLLLKILKFIGILFLFLILLIIIGFVVGMIKSQF